MNYYDQSNFQVVSLQKEGIREFNAIIFFVSDRELHRFIFRRSCIVLPTPPLSSFPTPPVIDQTKD